MTYPRRRVGTDRGPECGCEHLHAHVIINAEKGDRFEVVGESLNDPEFVVARSHRAGKVQTPNTAWLQCCSCDWIVYRQIRWE